MPLDPDTGLLYGPLETGEQVKCELPGCDEASTGALIVQDAKTGEDVYRMELCGPHRVDEKIRLRATGIPQTPRPKGR